MKSKIIFGKYEATCIVMATMGTQLFLNLPRSMMEAAGTAAWMLMLYISVLALILFYIIARLYKKFEGKDLLDLAEHIGGDFGRIIVGIFILAFFLYINPVILREFAENLKIIALPQSPLSFVIIFFMAVMIIASYRGLEAIVRFSAIVVPIIIIGYILIITGVVQYLDISRITPWLGKGPYEIFINGMPRVSIFAAVIILYFLFPFIKTNRNFKAIGYSAIILNGLFFFIGVLAFSMVYQYPTGTENFLPIYQLALLMDYGRFFQRVESVFLITWVATAFLHLSINLFLTAYVFQKTFRLEYYKPLIIPFGILFYTLSFLPGNLMAAIETEKQFRTFAWIVSFLLPFLLLVIARFVKKNRKKEAGST